jgi:catechol 2,3-dioxygenase-like lactoylglutathione lyase family enzyme
MSTIKVEDIAYVRFRAPDLAAMRAFLEDFGLVATPGEGEALYMRGTGPGPVLHVTEPGEAGFAALGFKAESLEDLKTLAEAEGATLVPSGLPGGGQLIRLSDPDGHVIEVIAGQTAAPPLPADPRAPWNDGAARARLSATKRVPSGPAHVMRLGHAVLNVSDFRASERWYKDRLGFITSDEIEAAPGFSLGAFLRCDRGATPTDHHTLFLAQSPKGPGFNHAAFEVRDFDDLMVGHEHLKAAGRTQEWGVGRHILGSQVFDYWRDPWGHAVEHWTDGDLFTAETPPNTVGLPALLGVQWGPSAPPTMA